jgi:hypothetical protein
MERPANGEKQTPPQMTISAPSVTPGCVAEFRTAILLLVLLTVPVYADEVPNGRDAIVSTNAINIPASRFLLARRGSEYCAVRLISSRWTTDESSSTYVAYYVPQPTIRFTSPEATVNKGEVYMKQPLRIIGRLAAARSKRTIFCGKLRLEWSGAPNNSGWIYLDEEKTLQLAPTRWTDIKVVDSLDKALKWMSYGDAKEDLRVRLGNGN